ncbi:MAG TPA: response regulator transcription factor [Baekduia sp.]|nr:response regulator transcription factor [Baekduia sp.]
MTEDERLALPEGAVRVLVADPHEATRIGMAVLLKRQGWVGACLMAESQGEARRVAAAARPDVAVVDVSSLGPFVEPAVAALREAHGAMAVVLTARCAAVRVAGVLPSSATGAEIVEAVRAAVVDRRPVRPPSAEQLLTERERQVLELLSLGLTNREIAERLHLGPDSIKKHARSVYRKLGVRNRTEAVHQALALFAA